MKLSTADFLTETHTGHYWIDSDLGLWIEEYRGTVGLADLKAMLSCVVSDPCWRAEYHGLIDFSWAQVEMTANEVLRLALMMKQERNRSKGWLVFVAPNSTAFGMVRMLSYWSRNTDRIKIFNTRGEADQWLKQTSPSFRKAGYREMSGALLNAV